MGDSSYGLSISTAKFIANEIKEIYKKHDPVAIEPLVERKGYDPLSFLEMFPEQSPNKGKL